MPAAHQVHARGDKGNWGWFVGGLGQGMCRTGGGLEEGEI